MYEDVCYEQNYINEVICRLDFATPVVELRKSLPKNIYDVVHRHYPIAEPQDVIGTELSITPIGTPSVNQVATKQWVFWSRDRKNKCTIEPNDIIFSIRKYTVFDDIQVAITDILQVVMNNYPENVGKRLGLRYINSFPFDKYSRWIDEKFLTAFKAHRDERTIQIITSLEYAVVENELNVRLNYGLANPNYPAIMKNESFLIDIDAYTTGIVYEDDIEKFINGMHEENQSCFEKMITDVFREENS